MAILYIISFICLGIYIFFGFHPLKECLAACQEAEKICQAIRVELVRCAATQWAQDWAAFYGEPYNQ
ncbi:MAG: hypothetical protein JWO58_2819 [Chitinophagaceae bacterium]|nr:hypothetical protein [Chitinophagaceae bacterium]